MSEELSTSQSKQLTKPVEGEVIDIFQQIDDLISKLLAAEDKLEHGYAKLGLLLTEVSEKEHWREAGFPSMSKYMESLQAKYHRGKTQLWRYFSSVREMRPYLNEGQMNQMGISKLDVLKKATQQLGFPPNNEVIQEALDPTKTVSDVRKAVAQNHSLTQEEQNGTWFELSGFFLTTEERAVIQGAFKAAWKTDPIVDKGLKESVRTKEALLRLSMEFLASHQEEE